MRRGEILSAGGRFCGEAPRGCGIMLSHACSIHYIKHSPSGPPPPTLLSKKITPPRALPTRTSNKTRRLDPDHNESFNIHTPARLD